VKIACALSSAVYEVTIETSTMRVGPKGITVDATSGELYVTFARAHPIVKISTDFEVSIFAGNTSSGRIDGVGTLATFGQELNALTHCSFDNNIYVADSTNSVIRQITKSAVVTTIAGGSIRGHEDGVGSSATFNKPGGIACNPNNGHLFISDTENAVIRVVEMPSAAVSTLAGNSALRGHVDGMGTYALFTTIGHIAQNLANGLFYVTDYSNHAVRSISVNGVVKTVAGSPTQRSSLNGIGTSAAFNYPLGIACDAITGNIVVSDYAGHQIRVIELATGKVITVAGTGLPGGYATPSAIGTYGKLSSPAGVAVYNGKIYVAEVGNKQVRLLTPMKSRLYSQEEL